MVMLAGKPTVGDITTAAANTNGKCAADNIENLPAKRTQSLAGISANSDSTQKVGDGVAVAA